MKRPTHQPTKQSLAAKLAVKAYLSSLGRKGGAVGTGAAKVRGGAEHYKNVSRLGVAARRAGKVARQAVFVPVLPLLT